MIPEKATQDKFHMVGDWYNGKDGMKLVSEEGGIFLPYYAREVNIVASNPANLIIRLDGEIIPSEHAGSDVIDGIVEVNDARLYNIIDSPVAGIHYVEIITDSPGFEIFTFTFG